MRRAPHTLGSFRASCPRNARAALACWIAAVLVLAGPATRAAAEAPRGWSVESFWATVRPTRLSRLFDWRSGMPTSYVSNACQDRDGFLWIATPGGLVRYDGSQMVLWAKDSTAIVRGTERAASLYVIRGREGIGRVVPGGVEPIRSPPGLEEGLEGAVVTEGGALWVAAADRIHRLSATGEWEDLTGPLAGTKRLRIVGPGPGESVLVASREALWRVEARSQPVRLASVRGVAVAIPLRDGTTAIASNVGATATVYKAGDGALRTVYEQHPGRLMDLTERGDSLWAALDTGLVEFRDGREASRIDAGEALPSGGALLVDREGCLWVSTFRGLVQFPAPEVVVSGSPSVVRYLSRARRRIWTTYWGFVVAQRPESFPTSPPEFLFPGYQAVCVDDTDRSWTSNAGNWIEFSPEGSRRVHAGPAPAELAACSPGEAGRLWFPGWDSLWVLEAEGRAPREVPSPFPAGERAGEFIARSVLEGPDGVLHVAGGSVVCRAPVEALLRGAGAAWSCARIAATTLDATDIARLPSGSLWVSTHGSGIFRSRSGAWEKHPVSNRLASPMITALAPSPSGGIWIVGQGVIARVVERPDLPAEVDVLEDLSSWQGIPARDGVGIEETEDGTLWVGTAAGLMRVPPAQRRARPTPPPIVIVNALVDGRALALGSPIELPYRRNRLEARIAALSYRDPGAIRYRHRLRPSDPWSEPSADSVYRFADLSPGEYALEVQASLDGARWSDPPARLEFRVGRPWYLRWWFFALVLASAAGAAWIGFRIRLAALLRLERQRTHIAMDLHDEVGSGLGSIGVLAGLLARKAATEGGSADYATRIATISKGLSLALGDIVWSLRPTSGTLDALMAQVLERGRPLFAEESVRFDVEAPDPVPAAPLSLAVRRNVLLIALEALHNAARHAAARRVTVRLAPEGRQWRLTVEDDGSGLPPPEEMSRRRRGLGLEGMQWRAAEIGAALTREAVPGGGTRVSVLFAPGAEGLGPARGPARGRA